MFDLRAVMIFASLFEIVADLNSFEFHSVGKQYPSDCSLLRYLKAASCILFFFFSIDINLISCIEKSCGWSCSQNQMVCLIVHDPVVS